MTRRRLRALHVIPAFFPAVRYGGPIESVLRTCQHLLTHLDVEVATTDADGDGRVDMPTGQLVDVQGVPVRYFGRWPRTGFAFSAGLMRHLLDHVRSFDVVHVTSVFSFPSWAGCEAARRHRVPFVVSPRGGLRAWAVAHKQWKKLPYWWLVERRNLSAAAAIHVTSEEERHELERLLPRARVAAIPNGVTPAVALEDQIDREASHVVFLGRLHPVKALDQLVIALSRVSARVPGLHATFAGPDDVGEWVRLQHQISTLHPRPSVSYVGPLAGTAKATLLRRATVLVLPSHSENFGQVVVEAMAAGTPVIASRFTPWQILEQHGAGLWVRNDPDSLAGAILHVLQNPEAAADMGRAGERLSEQYAWPGVAAQLAELYQSLVPQEQACASS